MSNFRSVRSRAGLGVIGFALIAAATPAIAGSNNIDVVASSAKTKVVKISDLNLASADGMKTANRRVSFAAQYVCAASQSLAIEHKIDYLNCRTDALKAAHLLLQQRMATNSTAPLRFIAG